MTLIRVEKYKRRYYAARTDLQKLIIETCPNFERALKWAADGMKTYDSVRCTQCKLSVRVIPAIQTVDIRGNCPKK